MWYEDSKRWPLARLRYNKKLSQEERERRAGGLYVEYTGSHDVAEALLSTQELAAPGFLPKLVRCSLFGNAHALHAPLYLPADLDLLIVALSVLLLDTCCNAFGATAGRSRSALNELASRLLACLVRCDPLSAYMLVQVN